MSTGRAGAALTRATRPHVTLWSSVGRWRRQRLTPEDANRTSAKRSPSEIGGFPTGRLFDFPSREVWGGMVPCPPDARTNAHRGPRRGRHAQGAPGPDQDRRQGTAAPGAGGGRRSDRDVRRLRPRLHERLPARVRRLHGDVRPWQRRTGSPRAVGATDSTGLPRRAARDAGRTSPRHLLRRRTPGMWEGYPNFIPSTMPEADGPDAWRNEICC